jgi:hypothetical protein
MSLVSFIVYIVGACLDFPAEAIFLVILEIVFRPKRGA